MKFFFIISRQQAAMTLRLKDFFPSEMSQKDVHVYFSMN